MLKIIDKSKCCGCGSCAATCPQKNIQMLEDSEGFPYPKLNSENCSRCKICLSVCPFLNERKNIKNENVIAHIVQNKDKYIRKHSSSGGAFSAIAEYILEQGGVVFGAAYGEDFQVIHICINNKNDLYKLRGSKYVQSDTKFIFEQIKKELTDGKLVCFSGTPCQTEAVKLFLIKDYENLIIIDLVCHAVSSPKVWKKYIDYHKAKSGKIKTVSFRDKKYGYAYSSMGLYFENGKKIFSGSDVILAKDLFFRDISSRPSCFACPFKNIYRSSDFTLHDCWHVYEFDKKMDDDLGTTAIWLNSRKSQIIFEKIKSKIHAKQIDWQKVVELDADMAINCIKHNSQREIFFADLDILSMQDLIKKYMPFRMKKMIARFLKPLLHCLGLSKYIKRRAM